MQGAIPSIPVSAPAIDVTDVHKAFGATKAVDGVSVQVPTGRLVALLGPSGSGKTTLLRMIAGFEVPDAGEVAIGGRTVAGPTTWVEPEQRRIGMVFQDGALFPHLTVARNLAFGEPASGQVERCLDLVGLAHRSKSYPHELSGGERQRVALARALAIEPTVVLLDEPFASLDATLRLSLREEVAGILHEAGASALLVTHDQQEALSMADDVVVMRDGRVEQVGTPVEVYSRPNGRWVAEFLGAAEVVSGRVDGGMVDCELGRFPSSGAQDGAVEVVVRPEAIVLVGPDDLAPDDQASLVRATVGERAFYGHDQVVHLTLESGRRVHCRTTGDAGWQPGDDVRIRVAGPVTVLPPPAP